MAKTIFWTSQIKTNCWGEMLFLKRLTFCVNLKWAVTCFETKNFVGILNQMFEPSTFYFCLGKQPNPGALGKKENAKCSLVCCQLQKFKIEK